MGTIARLIYFLPPEAKPERLEGVLGMGMIFWNPKRFPDREKGRARPNG